MLISGFKGFSVSSALYQSEFSSTMNKLCFFVPPADGLHCLDSHCLCHQVSFFFFSRWESQNRHYKYSDSYRRFALNKINCILHLPPKMSLWQGRPQNSMSYLTFVPEWLLDKRCLMYLFVDQCFQWLAYQSSRKHFLCKLINIVMK